MPFFEPSRQSHASERSNRPSRSYGSHDNSSTSRYADMDPPSHTHSRSTQHDPSHSYQAYPQIQPTPRSTYSDRASTRDPYSHRHHADLEQVRESSHSRHEYPNHRSVSPLGTSRFEQPSPWSGRTAPSRRPHVATTMRDEHGFSIRESRTNAHSMSAHAPFSSNEYEYLDPLGRRQGVSEAADVTGRSGRREGGYEADGNGYDVGSNFRNGGVGEWENF